MKNSIKGSCVVCGESVAILMVDELPLIDGVRTLICRDCEYDWIQVQSKTRSVNPTMLGKAQGVLGIHQSGKSARDFNKCIESIGLGKLKLPDDMSPGREIVACYDAVVRYAEENGIRMTVTRSFLNKMATGELDKCSVLKRTKNDYVN